MLPGRSTSKKGSVNSQERSHRWVYSPDISVRSRTRWFLLWPVGEIQRGLGEDERPESVCSRSRTHSRQEHQRRYIRGSNTQPHAHTDAHVPKHGHANPPCVVVFQSKYKEEGRKETSMSLYSVLPETPETQHAREASELQSEVPMWRRPPRTATFQHFPMALA